MAAGVFRSEAEAHGERARWVHDRHGTRCECVEGSGDNELAVVVSSEVTKSSDLNIHEEFLNGLE
jgi:hypothetical protein